MASAKRKIRNVERERKIKIFFFVLLFTIFVCLVLYEYHNMQQQSEELSNPGLEIVDATVSTTTIPETPEASTTIAKPSKGKALYLHMINCGQGDCFLLEINHQFALIDCGDNPNYVINYLNNLHVTELQFVVATHPHDDHIGALESVIDNFKCNRIYAPKTYADVQVGEWYINLWEKIRKNKIEVVNPKENDKFTLGDVEFNVIEQFTPKEADYTVNNYSTVIKCSYGKNDILFVGDAEKEVEYQMLKEEDNIQVEILKVGHHGSSSSTTQKFLDAVSPKYALISCGVGNQFHHPTEKVMNRLQEKGVSVYRTDENGDVKVTITKTKIYFGCKAGDYKDGLTLAKAKGGKS